jgi:hypothetical protein
LRVEGSMDWLAAPVPPTSFRESFASPRMTTLLHWRFLNRLSYESLTIHIVLHYAHLLFHF